tara:strand:+ start:44 stop:496 length:453 start_codon:yes stop_codon:yes gene_type:complete
MSVILKSQSQINNIAENISEKLLTYDGLVEIIKENEFYKKRNRFGAEDVGTFIHRALWYGYVANKTAYELQYRENIDIDFDSEDDKTKEMTDKDIADELGSLLYNIYTNDGNCFLQDDWVNVIDMVAIYFKDKNKAVIPDNAIKISDLMK